MYGWGTVKDSAALGSAFDEVLAQARNAWPSIHVEATAFRGYVAARIPADVAPPDALVRMHLADLYLACACVGGDAHAMGLFDAQVLSAVPKYIARISKDPELVEQVRQRLREKMLLEGAIGEYGGRGPLGGWVRVAAIRTAMNVQRGARRAADLAATSIPIARAASDPELSFLRSRYADDLKEAFDAALCSLTLDQRNVLRMHYLDDLTIDEIASSYGVHRSTAARWIAETRASILAATRLRLRDRIAATASEVESLIRLLWSHVELTIREVLS